MKCKSFSSPSHNLPSYRCSFYVFSGAVVSVFTGGAFFGAAVAGITTNFLGRRKTIMMGSLIFCLGGGLQTGAQNLGYLYSGRAIAGLGVGILVMIIPLYQAEIAHPAIRGRLTGLQQLFIGLGATTAGKSLCQHVVPTRANVLLQHIVPMALRNTLPQLTTNNGSSHLGYKSSQQEFSLP